MHNFDKIIRSSLFITISMYLLFIILFGLNSLEALKLDNLGLGFLEIHITQMDLKSIHLLAFSFVISAIPYHIMSESLGLRKQIVEDWNAKTQVDENISQKLRASLTTVQALAGISITLTIFVTGILITDWDSLEEFRQINMTIMVSLLAIAAIMFLVNLDSIDSSLDPSYLKDIDKLRIFRLANLNLFQIAFSCLIWALFFGTMALSPYIPLLICPTYTLCKAYYQIRIVKRVKG